VLGVLNKRDTMREVVSVEMPVSPSKGVVDVKMALTSHSAEYFTRSAPQRGRKPPPVRTHIRLLYWYFPGK
jgi:hypothetical protein